MDFKDLVTIYTVNNSVQAEIIKNALQADGIRCFIEGGNQAAEAGLIAIEIKVQVPAADAHRPRKIIEAHEGPHQAKPHSWSDNKK